MFGKRSSPERKRSRAWGQLGGAADPLKAFVPLPGGSCETRKAPIILGGALVMPSGGSGTQAAAHITWEKDARDKIRDMSTPQIKLWVSKNEEVRNGGFFINTGTRAVSLPCKLGSGQVI